MCLRVIVTGILNFGHLVNADFYLRANQNSLRRHGVVIEITILKLLYQSPTSVFDRVKYDSSVSEDVIKKAM